MRHGVLQKAPDAFWDADMDMGNVPNAILVGNFGDGRINVYDQSAISSGRFAQKKNLW